MKKAKKLLRKTTFSDKEISYDLGFRHVSSFCREFKEVTGKTPSEYRKRFRIFCPFQMVTHRIVRIVNAIGKIANAIVRFVNKIRRIANRNRFTNGKKGLNLNVRINKNRGEDEKLHNNIKKR